jgi:hypothetical protein
MDVLPYFNAEGCRNPREWVFWDGIPPPRPLYAS